MTKKPNSNSQNEIVNKERKIEEQPPGIPSWVKVSAFIAVIVVLLIVMIMLITGGEHGPGRHLPGGNSNVQIEQHEMGIHPNDRIWY
ncbi:hypothetical protein J2S74_003790 [Evansella vedderi]|uniref:Uncharacterized protein n=1 Tax=Evansella vedderi TaxID=38282 RepID=A0ABT9ZZH4_9BACI|nr:hypothetical protein [Evansella vedderi]MDQ0256370.1 hypothetical protein [Evansella vedderi]